MNNIKEYKIFESPDHLYLPHERIALDWYDDEALAFGVYDGEMLVSAKFGKGHINLRGIDISKDFREDTEYRTELDFCGRLWYQEKIISFWDFPKNYTILMQQLKKLEIKIKQLHGDIVGENFKIDDDWLIEVLVDDNKNQLDNVYKFWGDSEITGDDLDLTQKLQKSILINVGDYKGSIKRSAKELAKSHTESPIEREKEIKRKLKAGEEIVKKGWGSRSKEGKLPKDMTPAEYKHIKTKYKYTENQSGYKLNYIKNFKLFESPDNIILKNKEDLPHSSPGTITFGYCFDDMMVSDIGANMTHFILANIKYKSDGHTRTNMKYAGRLWLNEKIISFWDYPTKKEIHNIIEDIETEYNEGSQYITIDLLFDDNKFLVISKNEYDLEYDLDKKKIYLNGVEVEEIYESFTYKPTKKIYEILRDAEFGVPEYDVYKFHMKLKHNTNKINILNDIDNWKIEIDGNTQSRQLIPLGDFISSKKRSAKELAKSHTKSPIDREKEIKRKLKNGEEIVKKGWGSRSKEDKLPKNMTPAEYKHIKTKHKFTEKKSINT